MTDRTAASLAGLSSGDVSDACDALGVPAARDGGLRPLWAGCPAVAGTLGTLVLRTARGAGSPLPELVDALGQLGHPLVLVDLDGRVDVQCWGGILATAARSYGVVGAIVHGAARDVDGLATLGFPTYARAVVPVGAAGRVRFAGAGGRVRLGGVDVGPGWTAVVDSSGAVFVPPDRVEAVARAAHAAVAAEHAMLRSLRTGTDPAAALRRRPDA